MGTPSLPADDAASLGGGVERRLSHRTSLPTMKAAWVNFDFTSGALLLDVCNNGIGVLARCQAPRGTFTNLRFQLPDSAVPIETTGLIAWSDESGRMGVRLTSLSQTARAELARWISAVEHRIPLPGATNPDPAPPTQLLEALERELHGLEAAVVFEIVVRRMLALTGAIGAAIAFSKDDRMICVASCGSAPDVGVELHPASGLSGECVRTGRVVRCIDTDTDARADRPLCRSLGIRSAVVVPIRESSHVAGFLEAFSGTAHGFSSEHVRLLRSMAELVCKARNKHMRVEAPQPEGQPIKNRGEQLSTVLATLEQQDHEAASPSAPHEQVRTDASAAGSEQLPDAIDVLSGGTRPALCSSVSASASVPVPASSPQIFRGMPPGGSGHGQSHPQRRTLRPAPRLIKRATGFLKTIVRTAVIVWITCTIVLASLFAYQRTSRQWRHMESSRSTRQGSSQPHSTKEPNQQPADGRMLDIGPFADAVVSRGMALYQFTADVMTTLVAGTSAPPAGGSGTQPISGGKLLYKVDPVYPARIASGDREVILRITVDKTGTVQGVQVLSGPPALADRARAAVKRWRYEPFLIDNRPVNMERIVILPISAPKG